MNIMKTASREAAERFIESARQEFNGFLDVVDTSQYEKAVEMILEAQKRGNRIHVTGIGKPGHVASYAASLLSSTGNPCYFLHGTEAVHGSCGQLVEGDVVICISNSGETQELKATCIAIRNNGCRMIAITGNPDSWLGRFCEACLFAGVKSEGGPLNRAPRNSILAENFCLQLLSVYLQSEKEWDPVRYVRCHPGGKLGEFRADEKH
ncbi:MAG: SIS domain-containing protein [Spirochaetales bacterium]|nr:SIS domain-containing protein [Spirochaetales bacterium]